MEDFGDATIDFDNDSVAGDGRKTSLDNQTLSNTPYPMAASTTARHGDNKNRRYLGMSGAMGSFVESDSFTMSSPTGFDDGRQVKFELDSNSDQSQPLSKEMLVVDQTSDHVSGSSASRSSDSGPELSEASRSSLGLINIGSMEELSSSLLHYDLPGGANTSGDLPGLMNQAPDAIERASETMNSEASTVTPTADSHSYHKHTPIPNRVRFEPQGGGVDECGGRMPYPGLDMNSDNEHDVSAQEVHIDDTELQQFDEEFSDIGEMDNTLTDDALDAAPVSSGMPKPMTFAELQSLQMDDTDMMSYDEVDMTDYQPQLDQDNQPSLFEGEERHEIGEGQEESQRSISRRDDHSLSVSHQPYITYPSSGQIGDGVDEDDPQRRWIDRGADDESVENNSDEHQQLSERTTDGSEIDTDDELEAVRREMAEIAGGRLDRLAAAEAGNQYGFPSDDEVIGLRQSAEGGFEVSPAPGDGSSGHGSEDDRPSSSQGGTSDMTTGHSSVVGPTMAQVLRGLGFVSGPGKQAASPGGSASGSPGREQRVQPMGGDVGISSAGQQQQLRQVHFAASPTDMRTRNLATDLDQQEFRTHVQMEPDENQAVPSRLGSIYLGSTSSHLVHQSLASELTQIWEHDRSSFSLADMCPRAPVVNQPTDTDGEEGPEVNILSPPLVMTELVASSGTEGEEGMDSPPRIYAHVEENCEVEEIASPFDSFCLDPSGDDQENGFDHEGGLLSPAGVQGDSHTDLEIFQLPSEAQGNDFFAEFDGSEDFVGGDEMYDIFQKDAEEFNKENIFIQDDQMLAPDSTNVSENSWMVKSHIEINPELLESMEDDPMKVSIGTFFRSRSEALGSLGDEEPCEKPQWGHPVVTPPERLPVSIITPTKPSDSNSVFNDSEIRGSGVGSDIFQPDLPHTNFTGPSNNSIHKSGSHGKSSTGAMKQVPSSMLSNQSDDSGRRSYSSDKSNLSEQARPSNDGQSARNSLVKEDDPGLSLSALSKKSVVDKEISPVLCDELGQKLTISSKHGDALNLAVEELKDDSRPNSSQNVSECGINISAINKLMSSCTGSGKSKDLANELLRASQNKRHPSLKTSSCSSDPDTASAKSKQFNNSRGEDPRVSRSDNVERGNEKPSSRSSIASKRSSTIRSNPTPTATDAKHKSSLSQDTKDVRKPADGKAVKITNKRSSITSKRKSAQPDAVPSKETPHDKSQSQVDPSKIADRLSTQGSETSGRVPDVTGTTSKMKEAPQSVQSRIPQPRLSSSGKEILQSGKHSGQLSGQASVQIHGKPPGQSAVQSSGQLSPSGQPCGQASGQASGQPSGQSSSVPSGSCRNAATRLRAEQRNKAVDSSGSEDVDVRTRYPRREQCMLSAMESSSCAKSQPGAVTHIIDDLVESEIMQDQKWADINQTELDKWKSPRRSSIISRSTGSSTVSEEENHTSARSPRFGSSISFGPSEHSSTHSGPTLLVQAKLDELRCDIERTVSDFSHHQTSDPQHLQNQVPNDRTQVYDVAKHRQVPSPKLQQADLVNKQRMSSTPVDVGKHQTLASQDSYISSSSHPHHTYTPAEAPDPWLTQDAGEPQRAQSPLYQNHPLPRPGLPETGYFSPDIKAHSIGEHNVSASYPSGASDLHFQQFRPLDTLTSSINTNMTASHARPEPSLPTLLTNQSLSTTAFASQHLSPQQPIMHSAAHLPSFMQASTGPIPPEDNACVRDMAELNTQASRGLNRFNGNSGTMQGHDSYMRHSYPPDTDLGTSFMMHTLLPDESSMSMSYNHGRYSLGEMDNGLTCVRVPQELRVPEVCCVGLSTHVTLPIHNPTRHWLAVQLNITALSVDGEDLPLSTSHLPFVMKEKLIVEPGKTEEVKVIFVPRTAGAYVAQVAARCSPVVSDHSLNPAPLPAVTTLQAVAEKPHIQIVMERGQKVLSFGPLPWGCQSGMPITLFNRGRASVPVRLIISTKKSSWNCFTFDKFNVTDVSVISNRSRPTMPSLTPSVINHTLPGCTSDMEAVPVQFTVYFKAPSRQADKVSCIGPPEEFTGQVYVEVDTPSSLMSLGSVTLLASAGTAKLHAPRDMELITLQTSVGSSCGHNIPIRNAGNIPLEVALEVTHWPDFFTVVPMSLVIEPGGISDVTVKFQPNKSNNNKFESLLLMFVEPDGPGYEFQLLGDVAPSRPSSTTPVTQAPHKLRSNKDYLSWGGLNIGGKKLQSLYLRNSSDDKCKYRLEVKGGSGNEFQLQSSFHDKEWVGNSREIVLKSLEDFPVNVLFSPLQLKSYAAKLQVKQINGTSKYAIPLMGYGGVSKLVIENVNSGQDHNYWQGVGSLTRGRDVVIEMRLRNKGSRAAYVKAISFQDLGCKQRLPEGQMTMKPNEFVLKENQCQEILIYFSPSERETSLCFSQTSIVACVAFLYGDEVSRIRYRKSLQKRNLRSLSLADHNPVKGVVFDMYYQDEDLVTEGFDMKKFPNDVELFYGQMNKLTVALVGEPDLQPMMTHNVPQYHTAPTHDSVSATLPATWVVDTPISQHATTAPSGISLPLLPSNSVVTSAGVGGNPSPSRARRGLAHTFPQSIALPERCEEIWSVHPQQIILPLNQMHGEPIIKRVHLTNYSNRDISFEMCWPGHCITVTPEQGEIRARSFMIVCLSASAALLKRGTTLPWQGRMHIMCDGDCKFLDVQIRSEIPETSSPSDIPTLQQNQNFGPPVSKLNYNTVTSTPSQSFIRLTPENVAFPRTIAGKLSQDLLKMTNISSYPLKWTIQSISPAYMKEAGMEGAVLRCAYQAFWSSTNGGMLRLHGAEEVPIMFCPREPGQYSQFLEILVETQDPEVSTKCTCKISLTGEAVSGRLVAGTAGRLSPPLAYTSSDYLENTHNNKVDKARKRSTTMGDPNAKVECTVRKLEFPVTQCGQRNTCKLQIKNKDSQDHQIELINISPRPPFDVKHKKLTIQSKHYLHWPVTFCPQRPNQYQGVFSLRADTGEHFTVSLIGQAIHQ